MVCARHKTLEFTVGSGYEALSCNEKGLSNNMKPLIGGLLLGLPVPTPNTIDRKDLAPCRPAAARLCDRSGGMTWSNLLRCGATLAANSSRVGNSCRAVLKRYGQL